MQTMLLEDATTIILIHLTFKREGHEYERIGNVLHQKESWGVACAPNIVTASDVEGRGAWQRSDDPRAVNCPVCMDTQLFKDKMAVIKSKRRALT